MMEPTATAAATATEPVPPATTIRQSSSSSFNKNKTHSSYDTKELNTTIGTEEEVTTQSKSRCVSFDGRVIFDDNDMEETPSGEFSMRSLAKPLSMGDYYEKGGAVGSMPGVVPDPCEGGSNSFRSSQFRVYKGISETERNNEDDDGEERLHLSEDVYAFIAVCPIFSLIFPFSCFVICVKYIIFAILLTDTYTIGDGFEHGRQERLIMALRFFLIPVAVTMQEDLMTVYANIANKKWDLSVLKLSKHATLGKFVFANVLRFIDGVFSLLVCFSLMLMTNEILGIFLNFAALHFLQYIDDIVFELIEHGFGGDKFEQATIQCNQVTFPRRVATVTEQHNEHDEDGEEGAAASTTKVNYFASVNNFFTALDTVFMATTIVLCVCAFFAVHFIVYGGIMEEDENTFYITHMTPNSTGIIDNIMDANTGS